MPDENQPVTVAALLPSSTQPLSQATVWLQRVLLAMLASAHGILPFLFIGGQSDLLRDTVFHAQLSLLLIGLALGGLRWWGFLLLFASTVPQLGWWRAYPDYLHGFIFRSLVLPLFVLAISLVVLRLSGWRGSWHEPLVNKKSPWQVTIWQLFVATTCVAACLAASGWAREILPFPDYGFDPMFNFWIVVAIDGVGTGILSLLAVWAIGTRGATIVKSLLLLATAILFAGCQIYAFKMEHFWHLPAVTSLGWITIVTGSLIVWRIAGWQVRWTADANWLGPIVRRETRGFVRELGG